MPVIIDGTLGVNAAAVTTTSWNPTNLNIPGNATIGDSSADTLTINGSNITLAANGARILGDFSNATIVNRLAFQDKTTNSNTVVGVIPNGTATLSALQVSNNSNLTAALAFGNLQASSTEVALQSGIRNAGTYVPLTFYTSGAEKMRIGTDGKVGIGTAGAAATQLLTVKGRFNSDLNNNYYGAWGEGNTATSGYSFFSVGEWYSAAAYFQKKEGESFAHLYAHNASHNIVLQGGSGTNGETSASGNVGIGTKFPSTKLHVYQGSSANTLPSNNQAVFEYSANGGIAVSVPSANAGGLYFPRGADAYYSGVERSGSSLNIRNAGATQITIDSSGSVGINNTTPSVYDKLVIGVSSASTGTGVVTSQGITLQNTNSTNGNYTTIQNRMSTGGQNAQIQFINVDHTYKGAIALSTRSAVGDYGERMRIDEGGNVGIATTAPEFKLDIGNSTIPFRRVTTNPGGHAVNSGYVENRNIGIALGNAESAWITKGAVSANRWVVKFTGIWENNYEGGGLTPPPAEIYVVYTYPWINVGSLAIEIQRDSSSGRLKLVNNSGSAFHFTGEISVIESPQSYIPAYTGSHIALNVSGSGYYPNMTGGLVLTTPCYSEYQFRWYGLASHTTTLTCGSYQMSEIIYTAHQSNGGTDNNEYVRGKWGNNHDSHVWTEFEHSGNIDAMITSFTVSQNDVSNSGKLIIQENYPTYGPSYSFSNLIIRTYYGGWNISHT